MDRNPSTCFLRKTVHSHGVIFVDIFHVLVLKEYWFLTEYCLSQCWGGGVIIVALSKLVFMNSLNKTKSAVFLYCRFTLFLKDPSFPEYL